MKNNTINNRNRTDDGKYAKWDVCDREGCNNILGDLDDGLWALGHNGEFYCLNHDADKYEQGENYLELTTDGKPVEYKQAK